MSLAQRAAVARMARVILRTGDEILKIPLQNQIDLSRPASRAEIFPFSADPNQF
jgi:hypothetical protein